MNVSMRGVAMLVVSLLVALVIIPVTFAISLVTAAHASAPAPSPQPSSVTLAASSLNFQAGQPVTLVATTDVDVAPSASTVHITDTTTGTQVASCATGTTCTTTVVFYTGGPHTYTAAVNLLTSSPVTLTRAAWSVSLVADKATFSVGEASTLTATANQSVSGTSGNYRLAIYETTTDSIVATCTTGATCAVTLTPAFYHGAPHSYVASVTSTSGSTSYSLRPDSQADSNAVQLARAPWTVTLTADATEFAVGQPVTLTATANQDVRGTDPNPNYNGPYYEIDIYDVTTDQLIQHCSSGTVCTLTSTSLYVAGDPHTFAARVAQAGNDSSYSTAGDVQATSNAVQIARSAWSVSLTTDITTFTYEQTVNFTAVSNQVVNGGYGAPFAMFLFDVTAGAYVSNPCQNGTNTCSWSSGFVVGGPHTYVVRVAEYNPNTGAESNVQATSNTVEIARQPWTVSLTTSQTTFAIGESATLTATANQTLSAYGQYSIFIIDLTTGNVVGYCPHNVTNTCVGTGWFGDGPPHTYRAQVSDQFGNDLGSNVQAVSNVVTLARQAWTLSLQTLSVTQPDGSGYVTASFQATANQNLVHYGLEVDLYDYTAGQGVGSCGNGTPTCTVSVTYRIDDGAHSFVAYVAQVRPSWYTMTSIQTSSNGVTPFSSQLTAGETTGGSNGAEKGCQCSHAEPVNTATGEFYLNSTDIGLAGVGPAVSVGRSYSSSNAGVAGVFGFGTSANFDSRLIVTTPGDSVDPLPRVVQIIQENGASVSFSEGADHTYVAPPRTLASLRWDAVSSSWVFLRHSREKLVFSAGGLLTSLADLDGNTVSLTRNASGQVTTISGSGGRTLTLTWSAGHITVAADSAGRTVRYGYDANANLTSVTGVDGRVAGLGYDSGHYITSVTKPGGGVTTNTYDSLHRVTAQQDPVGRVTLFSYGASATTTTAPDGSLSVETYSGGHLVSQTRASGTSSAETTTYVYDAANNVASVTDPTGAVTSSTYDALGHELTRTDPLGHVTTWSYDLLGDVVSITDPLGNQSTATYSTTGDALTSTSPGSHTQTWTHNPNGTIATSVDARGNSTSYSYDGAGRPASRTDPDGRTQSLSYNAAGIVTTKTDAAGKVTTLTSDAAGRVLTVKDPNAHTTTYTYDPDGNVLTTVDAGNHKSSQTYNSAGETTSATDANAKVTTYIYTPVGLPASVTDPNGNTTTLAYTAHHLVSSTDPDGRVTTYTNDLDGRRLTTTRPSGAVTSTVYDAAGEPTTFTDGNGKVSTVVYDADGRKLTVTDPLNRSASFAYTADSQVATLTLPGTQSQNYAYDAAGNLTQFTNADGKAATYAFDPAGLLSSKTEPGGLSTGYSYDSAGRVSVTTSPDLTTATNTYDSVGQLTNIHYSATGSTDIKFTYSSTGQRLSMVDATGTSSYTYDPVGRLLTEKNGAAVTIGYGYDPAGRLSSITYPGTHTVNYGYDKSGDVTSVGDWAGHSTAFTWTGDRQLATQVDPNGLTQTDSYDPTGQITAMTTTLAASVKAKFSYGYDAAGQLTSDTTIDPTTTASGVARTFGYDSNAQLTAVTTGTATGTYAATASAVLTTTPTAALTTNSAQQLTASTPATGPATSFTYNPNGARITSTLAAAGATPAATTTYTYSATGALASVVLPGTGGTISYKTNGDGVRQTRTQGTTTTKLLWSNNASTPRLLSDGTYSYIYGPTGNPIERINNSTQAIQYLLGDNIGTVRLITDPTGAILSTNRYDAYGNRTTHTGTTDSTIGYAGTWTDPTTGLIYLQARDYDPKTAQFTSYDPAADRTHQPYAYVANNPLKLTDPTGLDFWNDLGTNSLAFGAGVLDGATFGLSSAILGAVVPGYNCFTQNNGWFAAGSIVGMVGVGLAESVLTAGVGAGVAVAAIAARLAVKSAVRVGEAIGERVAARAAEQAVAGAGRRAAEGAVGESGGVAAAGPNPSIAIGEDMQGRVIPTAKKLGADYYNPPDAPASEWMQNNRNWLNDRMDQGCTIYDCGAAPGRSNYPSPTSPYYQMELDEIAKRGYPTIKVGGPR